MQRFGFLYALSFFFFKQKTAYEMRISDWSSDVCSSDLRLFAPRHPAGRDDRCEGGDAAKPRRVAQADRQRAVPAHRMAGDRLPAGIDREMRRDQRGQFVLDIGFHADTGGPGGLGRIDVEARALPEIIRLVVGHVLDRKSTSLNSR